MLGWGTLVGYCGCCDSVLNVASLGHTGWITSNKLLPKLFVRWIYRLIVVTLQRYTLYVYRSAQTVCGKAKRLAIFWYGRWNIVIACCLSDLEAWWRKWRWTMASYTASRSTGLWLSLWMLVLLVHWIPYCTTPAGCYPDGCGLWLNWPALLMPFNLLSWSDRIWCLTCAMWLLLAVSVSVPPSFCPRDFYFGYMEEDEYVRGLVMGWVSYVALSRHVSTVGTTLGYYGMVS